MIYGRLFPRETGICSNTKKLLLISTTGIGDTLLSTPAIRAVRKRFPDAIIFAVVDERRKEILEGNKNIDRVISLRKGLLSFFSLVFLLRKFKPDIAIIFHGNDPHILPLAYFSGAGEIIGHPELTEMPFFITKPVTFRKEIHTIEKRLDLARATGADENDMRMEIPISDDEIKRMDDFLVRSGYDGGLLVGLQLGAAKPYKCWPVQRFAMLSKKIKEKYNTFIVIVGDSKDRYLVDRFSNIFKEKFIDATGKLTIKETAALIKKMDLFITNDTGPMHISFAVGTPTIALFCPTDPSTIGPYNCEGKAIVISKERPCDPCITKKCMEPFCMEQITVEEVMNAVDEMFSGIHNINK